MALFLSVFQDILVYICLLMILVLLCLYYKTRDKDLLYFALSSAFYALGEICFDVFSERFDIPADFIFFILFYLFLFLFLKQRTKSLLKNPVQKKNARIRTWVMIALDFCMVTVIAYLFYVYVDCFSPLSPTCSSILPDAATAGNFIYPVLDFLLFGYYAIIQQSYLVNEGKAYLPIGIGAVICTAGDFLIAFEELFRVNTHLYGDNFQLVGLIVLIITIVIIKSNPPNAKYTTIDFNRRQSIDRYFNFVLDGLVICYLAIYLYGIKNFSESLKMMMPLQTVGVFLLILAVIRQNIINYDTKFEMNKMSKDASTDPLTELYTRKYTFTLMKSLLKSSRYFHYSFSAIMLDIDYFKKFNDTYGHINGDYVLKDIAQLIVGSIDTSNIVCRYGGEEFLIVLPGADRAAGMRIAEKIRQNVEMHEFRNGVQNPYVKITVSIGGVTADQTMENESELVKRADIALYRAKKERNTSAWFSAEVDAVV